MTIDATQFNAALEEIEASKGITRETVLAALEEALIKGYRNNSVVMMQMLELTSMQKKALSKCGKLKLSEMMFKTIS